MNEERIIRSSTRKKYAIVPSAEKTLLSREELRQIGRSVDTTVISSIPNPKNPAKTIPALPFAPVKSLSDDVLQLSMAPVRARESALDVPLRLIAPEDYHCPQLEDPPSSLPLARYIAALIKGSESVPMTWEAKRPKGPRDESVAEIKALRDAEARAQSSLRGGNKKKSARLFCLAGSLLYNYGNAELAIDSLSKALHLFEETDEARGVAFCHNIIGVSYHRRREYKMALVHYKKLEALGGAYAQSMAEINMGVSYAALGELEFAEMAFEDALLNAKASGESMLETIALGNLGLVCLRIGNMRGAQTNLELCLEQCSVAGDTNGAAISLLLLGEIYSLINDHQHALFYYEHAFRVGGEAHNADVVTVARVSIGIARGNAAIREVMINQSALMGQKNDVQSIVNLLPA